MADLKQIIRQLEDRRYRAMCEADAEALGTLLREFRSIFGWVALIAPQVSQPRR